MTDSIKSVADDINAKVDRVIVALHDTKKTVADLSAQLKAAQEGSISNAAVAAELDQVDTKLTGALAEIGSPAPAPSTPPAPPVEAPPAGPAPSNPAT